MNKFTLNGHVKVFWGVVFPWFPHEQLKMNKFTLNGHVKVFLGSGFPMVSP